jgi:hypothetical protein
MGPLVGYGQGRMGDAEILSPKCPTCGQVVDPDDPDTVEGIEMQDLPGMGQVHDYVEGMHYFFHAGCFPSGDPNWKRAVDLIGRLSRSTAGCSLPLTSST